jgi:hypothetical protein
VDPLTIGLGAAGIAAEAFGGKKGVDYRGINNRYLGQHPRGELDEQDYLAGERELGRRSAGIGALFGDQRAGAIRRSAQRGTSGSPAMEAILARSNMAQGGALERAQGTVMSGLNSLRLNREQFERDKLFKAWDYEINGAARNYANDQARHASFWNSLGEFAGALSGSGYPSSEGRGHNVGGSNNPDARYPGDETDY